MSRMIAALALVLLAAASSYAEDAVVLKGNLRNPGLRVVRDDAAGVAAQVVASPDTELKWPRSDVLRVEYGGTSMEYAAARELIKARAFDRALPLLDQALERPHPPLQKQYIIFDRACCLTASGDRAAAEEDYGVLLAMGADTRFAFPAARSLIEQHLEMKRLPDAKRVARSVDGVAKRERTFLRALVAEADGQFASARPLFASVSSRPGPLRDDAVLGGARCLLGMGRHVDAERAALAVVDAEAPDELIARAYLVIGDARKAAAKDRAGIEEALFAYLRIPALYAGDELTEARALHASALCLREAYGREGETRARQLLAMLKRKYPGNPLTSSM